MNANLLRNRWQHLPERVVRRAQAERLTHYLRTAVLPFSAYYRALFREHGLTADSIRSLEDLQRIPFTTKHDLMASPDCPEKFKQFILVPDERVLSRRPGTILRALVSGRQKVKQDFESEFRPIFMTATTGRSAEPTPFFYTQRDLANLTTAGKRLVEICTAAPGTRLLNTLPFAPHLAFWLTHYAGTAAGIMQLSSGGGKVLGTDGHLRHIRKFKPDVIIGMPTFLYHLMQEAAEQGLHCENLNALVLAGEKVSDGLRHKLRELAKELGVSDLSILATYGFTEAKMAWAECPCTADQVPSGYHLYPDLGIVEVIDPQTGKPLPPGQPGEIVFTPLEARGTVVVRYRTGDFIDGGLSYEPCPLCGRSLPRLVGNISRRSEFREMQFDKIKGTLVDFNELEHVLDDAPNIGAWQVELRKVNDDPHQLDELILHVQRVNGTDEALITRELKQRCLSHLEIQPNRVLFYNADEIRQLQGVGILLKEQKLVDRRPAPLAAPPASTTNPPAPSRSKASHAGPASAGLGSPMPA